MTRRKSAGVSRETGGSDFVQDVLAPGASRKNSLVKLEGQKPEASTLTLILGTDTYRSNSVLGRRRRSKEPKAI